jgi:hypothetical protein
MNDLKTKATEEKTQFNWPLQDVANGDWNKVYKIDQNAPFSFKMMDNHVFMKNIRQELKTNSDFKDVFSDKLSFIAELKKTDVWLKVDENIFPMKLIDVYTSFVKNLKDQSFDDQLFNCNEISFMGPMGPFKAVPLAECLNENILDKFIFNSLLMAKLPGRRMRIMTSGSVGVVHGPEMDQFDNVEIKQITDNGILFSSKDAITVNEFSNSELLKFHIDTRQLKKFVDNNLRMPLEFNEDFFYSEDDLRYFFIEEVKVKRNLSYKSGEDDEFFLFCRFADMLESDVPNIFLEFTEKVDHYFKHFANTSN